jgi:hypothetical protein
MPVRDDRVMVGNDGPYTVTATFPETGSIRVSSQTAGEWLVRVEWVTRAPEPEPPEPPSGTVIHDGSGRTRVAVLRANGDRRFPPVVIGVDDEVSASPTWEELERPIQVGLEASESLRARRIMTETDNRIRAALYVLDSIPRDERTDYIKAIRRALLPALAPR